MKNSVRISSSELWDLLLSLIALVMAFSIIGMRRLQGFEVVFISLVGVSTGFLLHEMAHKYVAIHFGYWAEYRANRQGLLLAIVMAFAGVIFAAPGAVMINRQSKPGDFYQEDSFGQEELKKQARKEELSISLAGPVTNIVLAIIFFLLISSEIAGTGLLARTANFALFINLTLAAFNLLPVGPLDGKKVFDNNRLVWAAVALPTILAALPVYLGMI